MDTPANPIEQTRIRLGLARLQFLRLLGAGTRYGLLDAGAELPQDITDRALTVDATYTAWTGMIESSLQQPTDAWGLARLLDVSPWQVTRWRSAGYLTPQTHVPRGQNHAPTALFGAAQWRALVATNAVAVLPAAAGGLELRQGPLAASFLRVCHKIAYNAPRGATAAENTDSRVAVG